MGSALERIGVTLASIWTVAIADAWAWWSGNEVNDGEPWGGWLTDCGMLLHSVDCRKPSLPRLRERAVGRQGVTSTDCAELARRTEAEVKGRHGILASLLGVIDLPGIGLTAVWRDANAGGRQYMYCSARRLRLLLGVTGTTRRVAASCLWASGQPGSTAVQLTVAGRTIGYIAQTHLDGDTRAIVEDALREAA